MSVQGVDYSYQVPTAEQIKANGYSFAMRYLSWEPGKNITPLELLALHALGLGVGFVWESTADRPAYGAAAGSADGAEAGRQLRALGVPLSVPIFWAFDTDDRGYPGWQGPLKAYGDAFARACGHFSFPYGSNRVIDFFQGGWQTQAWSDGAISPHAYLLQYASLARIAGCDENVLFNSYALWLPGAATPPKQTVTTPAVPQPTAFVYPGDVAAANPKVRLDMNSRGIRAWQGLLEASALNDGDKPITTKNTNRLVLAHAIRKVQEVNKWPLTGNGGKAEWAWLSRSASQK